MAISARTYEEAAVAGFRFTRAQFGILSNMHPGCRLTVPTAGGSVRLDSSETLYQALKFPHHPDAQQRIIDAGAPMPGKKVATSIRTGLRSDWDGQGRISAMRWAIRLKLAQHRQPVLDGLREAGERPIVEISMKDAFWGAKPQGDGTLIGCNVLGRLWMELRAELSVNPEAYLDAVASPAGDHRLLGHEVSAWQNDKPEPDAQGAFEI